MKQIKYVNSLKLILFKFISKGKSILAVTFELQGWLLLLLKANLHPLPISRTKMKRSWRVLHTLPSQWRHTLEL